MAKIHLVTGGVRSGKSSYAQSLCERLSTNEENAIYVATSKTFSSDTDFHRRVERHQKERGERWKTIEEPLEPSRFIDQMAGKVVLVDCLTLWLTNYMMQEGLFNIEGDDGTKDKTGKDADVQDASERALKKLEVEFDKLTKPWNVTFVFVTNELGSGTHAHDHATRKFVDAQGWLNQYVAQRADSVVQMVCGCPNVLKEMTPNEPKPGQGVILPTPQQVRDAKILDDHLSSRGLTMDEKGYFLIKSDHEKFVIRASFHSCMKNEKGEICDLNGNKLKCCSGTSPEPMKVWECRTAKEMTTQILEHWKEASELLSVGHAGYLGREVQKAEHALYSGTHYQQD